MYQLQCAPSLTLNKTMQLMQTMNILLKLSALSTFTLLAEGVGVNSQFKVGIATAIQAPTSSSLFPNVVH